MANVNIEQAVIGYDKAGLQLAVERLNYGVIGATRTVIDMVVPQVRVAVDSCWNGQSADAFKAKLERDAQAMKETLDKLQDEIVNEFAQMAKNIDNYDSALAESINQQ